MRIEYKKYTINNNKNINIKIAHISDIHFSHDYKIKRLEMIKEKIKTINPDYICITGDLIDIYDVIHDTNFKDFEKWLKEISKIAKTIISIGNHEYIKMTETGYTRIENIDWLKKIQDNNIIVLNNEIYNDEKITFIGYNPNYDYYYKDKEKNPQTQNENIEKLIERINKNYEKIDLVLSGHTHGGLIPSFIPGNFGIVSPRRDLFPKKVRGRVKLENTNLIISSGIMKLSRKSKITYLNDIYGSNINEIDIQNK